MTTALAGPKLAAWAVPLLGVMAAVQGSAPNINSTALVSLSRELNMNGGAIALAASIQTMAIAATVITTGLLADRIGRRTVLIAGLVVGAAGSALSGLAPITLVYLLGQALTGVGLGAVYGASFGYLKAVATPGRIAAALGVFGAVIGLATMIFSLLGSLLVGVDWRLAFFVSMILSLACLLLVPLTLPPIPRVPNTARDITGQLLLAVGILGFLYGVSQLGISLLAPTTLVPLLGGAVLLAVFFAYEAKAKGAFYPVAIFRTPVFIAAVLLGFIYNLGTAVAFLQTANLWQYVTDVSTHALAFWQAPLIASGVVAALITGRLMARGMSNATAAMIGTALSVIGFIALAMAAGAKVFWAFLPGGLLAGAGLVVVSIPFGNLIIKAAPAAQYGAVTSSRTTIGQFFYSIGLALATVVVNHLTLGGVVDKLTAAGVPPDQVGTAVTSVTHYAKTLSEPTTTLAREALADASASYASAYAVVMYVCAVLMMAAGVAAFVLLKRTTKLEPPQPEPARK